MISEASLLGTSAGPFFAPEQSSYMVHNNNQHPTMMMTSPYPPGMLCGMQVQQQQQQQPYGLTTSSGVTAMACSLTPPIPNHYPPNMQPSMSVAGSTTSLPTSAMDSYQHIAHVLLCYQQGGEDGEFVRKAIESLVKKLKDKRVELDALITAVTSGGKQHTQCVTIQRSLDGRLQVAGKKGVPHVVYARIWRWPNKLSSCAISPDHQDYICINPYHYERVVSTGIGPLDMKSLRVEPVKVKPATVTTGDFTAASSATMTSAAGDFADNSVSPHGNGFHHHHHPHNVGNGGSGAEWMPSSCAMGQTTQQNFAAYQQQTSGVNVCASTAAANEYELSQVQLPLIREAPEHWCTINYYELDTQIGDTFKMHQSVNRVRVDGGMDPQADRHGRVCLGALSNVHRGHDSERCRMHIGEGVELSALPDGRVLLAVKSQKSVFVRSLYLDHLSQVPYGTKVHRFTRETGETVVFDLRWAYREMCARTTSASMAVRAQAAAVAGLAPPNSMLCHVPDVVADSGVDGMRSAFCTLAISFVKGWGEGYNRNSIKETPCWIEIQVHRALQLLNHLLKSTGPI